MREPNENRQTDDDLRARVAKLEARRRDGRWWRRVALLLLALGASAPFVADALDPVPNTFSSGGVISASEMNANFSHLQDAITAVEGKVPIAACAAGQISRFDGTSWVCSDDATLTSDDPNIVVSDGRVSLGAHIEVSSLTAGAIDMGTGFRWNNSASNGTAEMNVFAHAGSCNASSRGMIRIIEHEDIGSSMDIGDALCFCGRYVNRTPEPDVTTYRWQCLYHQSDGD